MYDVPLIGVYQVGDLDASDVFAPTNGNVSVEALDVGNADYTAHCPKTTGKSHNSLSLHLPEIALQSARKFMIICQAARIVDVKERLETYWLFTAHSALSDNVRVAAFVGVGTEPTVNGPSATTELEGGRRTLVSAGTEHLDVSDVFISRQSSATLQIQRPIFVGIEVANYSSSGVQVNGDISMSIRRCDGYWPMRSTRTISS